MDDRISHDERGDPPGHNGGTGRRFEGLCDGSGFLGVSDVAGTAGWDGQLSAPVSIAAREPDIITLEPYGSRSVPEAASGEAELARILSPLFPALGCASVTVRRDRRQSDKDRAARGEAEKETAIPLAAEALARRLIGEFGSLTAVLAANRERLASLLGDDDVHRRVADFLRWLGDGFATALRFEISRAPVSGTSKALVDYLHITMGCDSSEQFRVIFLDSARRLIRDEQLGIGSVTATSVSPREVMRRALELGASALILVHNHPSGDTRPSAADIELTAAIVRAGRCLDIAVTDHVIVARTGWASLRDLGLI